MPSDAFLLTTSSGRSLDLRDPGPEDIFAEDIARALSKICRFGAQATSFYSVAQHALEVASYVPEDLRLAALHHDSHEAFAGDLPTPLKRLIASRSSVYDDICKRLDVAIGSAFGVDPSAFDHPQVKRADETVRVLEARGLLADGGREVRRALGDPRWLTVSAIDQSGVFGRILSPQEAEEQFLKAHAQWCP